MPVLFAGDGPPVDAAVVALDHLAVRVDHHHARVRVRRGVVGGAAARRAQRVRVREVLRLAARRERWRRCGTAGPRSRSAPTSLGNGRVLPVAADEHHVRVRRARRRTTGGCSPGRPGGWSGRAGRATSSCRRRCPSGRCPAQEPRADRRRRRCRPAPTEIFDVARAVRTSASIAGVLTRAQVAPVSVRLVDAVARRVAARSCRSVREARRVGRQVEGAAQRQPARAGDARERGARVGAAVDPDVVDVDRAVVVVDGHEQRRPARGDAGRVLRPSARRRP